MNILTNILISIDPNEVEGLLNRWGLNPVWISTALIVITVINLLIPLLGPFVYRLFGGKIDGIRLQFAAFKIEILDKLGKLDGTVAKIETGLDKIANTTDLVQGLALKLDTLTDLLIDVLEYSRVPDEVKEKVKGIKVNRDIADKEFKRLNREQVEAIDGLRKEMLWLKEQNVKLIEKQAIKKTKKR